MNKNKTSINGSNALTAGEFYGLQQEFDLREREIDFWHTELKKAHTHKKYELYQKCIGLMLKNSELHAKIYRHEN